MCVCQSQQLQQLQQQNLNLQQFVLVQPGHPIAAQLQPAQFIISQTPQGQQSECSAILISAQPCVELACFGWPLLIFGGFFKYDF